MSFFSRVMLIFRAKGTAALDNVEDPREMMNYGYAQQQELLVRVKQGLVDVATSKAKLAGEAKALRARVPQCEDQAKRALAVGREDLARMALERKHQATTELTDLDRQIAEVAADQTKLAQAQLTLSNRIEQFRTHKEVVSARYEAAQAQVRVGQALTGVGGELAELSMAVGRAEEKTERMRARASAIDELLQSGALSMPMGGDPMAAELNKLESERAVDDELARLKAQGQPASAPASGPAV